MTPVVPPSQRERQVMQYLLSTQWQLARRLPVPVGDRMIKTLQTKSWLELRKGEKGPEIRITATGLDALRMPLRSV